MNWPNGGQFIGMDRHEVNIERNLHRAIESIMRQRALRDAKFPGQSDDLLAFPLPPPLPTPPPPAEQSIFDRVAGGVLTPPSDRSA